MCIKERDTWGERESCKVWECLDKEKIGGEENLHDIKQKA